MASKVKIVLASDSEGESEASNEEASVVESGEDSASPDSDVDELEDLDEKVIPELIKEVKSDDEIEDAEYQPEEKASEAESSSDEDAEPDAGKSDEENVGMEDIDDVANIVFDDVDPDEDAGDEEEPAEEADAVDQEVEGGGDDIFEDKKSKPVKRKTLKRRIFPFLQKKKHIVRSDPREPPEYHSLDIRASCREFLQSQLKMDSKEFTVFEKSIFNAGARRSANRDLTVDSVEFKTIYLEIARYVVGAYGKLKKNEIIQELKTDTYGFKSKLFVSAQELEQREQAKIKNPMDVKEDANYPCPKCGGIKAFRQKVVDRSGDEGYSMRLWCQEQKCKFAWRLTG
jgi:DNA-directed RNA polymerase subunit M/transcription elongation factor TFIIS